MGTETGIAWTDATFNPWTGCLKISPACDHCYAEGQAKRNTKTFGGWQPGDERKRTSPVYWQQPRKWNREAAAAGIRRRVFCASMADVFDNKASKIWREDLFELIRETPSLDWQLLTKRPQNIAKMLPPDWGQGYPNVWLGTTTENLEELRRRWPILAAAPAALRFLSMEPLLDRADLCETMGIWWNQTEKRWISDTNGVRPDWVIVGGESGSGARPMRLEWAQSLVRVCRAASVPVFFKQVGSNRGPDWPAGITGTGTDPAQWPAELRVQEFPDHG